MALCYPTDTDWGCAFTPEQLEEMRSDAEKLRMMERSEAMAWYTLAALTAYQIGVCPTVVRPCAASCLPAGSWMEAPVSASSSSTGTLPLRTIGRSFTPHMEGGAWVNSCGCSSGDSCSCGPLSEVILPGPVGDIVSVVIDGVELPKTAYRVDNGNRLVRQDGGTWPICQDMASPAVAPPVFEPHVITWPTGERVELSRSGDVVTAKAFPLQTAGVQMNTSFGELPLRFQPNGRVDYSITVQDGDPEWTLGVYENGIEPSIQLYGAYNTVAPYSPSPAIVQWVAAAVEPAPTTGSFTVEYYRGAAPNEITRFAAGVLAGEFYKACRNDKCRLPRGATSVVRNGVTIELQPNLIASIASWPEIAPVIEMYNPHHLKAAPRVLSPDRASRTRTQTWGSW